MVRFLLTGLMSSLRLIGPALGYGLAAICMRMYVNLTETTTLKPRDPSWIGAWWLGKSVLGYMTCNLLTIIQMFVFDESRFLSDWRCPAFDWLDTGLLPAYST